MMRCVDVLALIVVAAVIVAAIYIGARTILAVIAFV